MNAGFTPGPWVAVKGISESDEMRCGVSADRGERQYLLATIENGAPGDFCDTEFANARLIAAAPELLDELRWLAAFAEMRSNDDSKTFARVNRGALRNIAARAKALHAKATGQ